MTTNFAPSAARGPTSAKRTFAAWLQGVTELLLFFPALAAAHGFLFGSVMPLWAWLGSLSLLYALGHAFRSALASIRQWQLSGAGLVCAALAAWLFAGASWIGVADGIVLFAAWMRGAQNRARGWNVSFPAGLYWIGLGCYFFASVLFPVFPVTRPLAGWVTAFGLAALALTVYKTNSSTLRQESLSGGDADAVGTDTKRRNRLLVFGLLAIVVFVGSFRAISEAAGEAMRYGFAAVAVFFRKLFSFFASTKGDDVPPPVRQPSLSELFGEGEPSAVAVFLEKALFGVTAVLIAVAAAVMLFVAAKRLKRWIKRLLDWYAQRIEVVGESGYVDEKQSLFDAEQWLRDRTDRWKRRFAGWFGREPDWNELPDNRARVRHAYRRLLLGRIARGYEHAASRTPRETAQALSRQAPLTPAESAAFRLYEDARYGGKEASDEEIEPLKELFGDKPR